jgi:hypothetical protein
MNQDLTLSRRRIEAVLAEIEKTRFALQSMGVDLTELTEPEDREAQDIVQRVLRGL